MGGLGNSVIVGLVVAGNDAGRHFDRVQVLLARADDRQLGAFGELRAPALHRGDELLRVHRHEDCAVFWPRVDALLEVIELTHRGHSAVLRGADVFAVVVLG